MGSTFCHTLDLKGVGGGVVYDDGGDGAQIGPCLEEALSRLVKVFYRRQGREQVTRLDTMTSDLQ